MPGATDQLAPLVIVTKSKNGDNNDYWDFDNEKRFGEGYILDPENGYILRLMEITVLRSIKWLQKGKLDGNIVGKFQFLGMIGKKYPQIEEFLPKIGLVS